MLGGEGVAVGPPLDAETGRPAESLLAAVLQPSAEITADTGSGSIRNKISGADVTVAERDELEMTVGDGATRVVLDAGSGSITIRQN